MKRWRKKNPHKVAATNRRRRYGLSQEEFIAMLVKQGGHCALCVGPAVCVDHSHITGKVRGLLCFPCNLGLGYFERMVERVGAIEDYLKGV